MIEILAKLKQNVSLVYSTINPRVKRVWKNYGYYISLAFLLVLFGTAAYIHRTNNSASDIVTIKPDHTPESVMAMAAAATAEPTPVPTPEPYSPVFNRPVDNGTYGDFTESDLVWNDTLGQWCVHNGIDISAPSGSVVLASESGTVSAVYEDDLYGTVVEITHEDNWITRYCSLNALKTAESGVKVRKGDVIGSVGNTAIVESGMGPHLHFEILHNSRQICPEFE